MAKPAQGGRSAGRKSSSASPAVLYLRVDFGEHGALGPGKTRLMELIAETGWPGKIIEAHLADPVGRGWVLRVGDRFVHAPALEGLKLLITGTVAAFHQENPLVQGVGKQELRERVQAPGEVFAVLGSMGYLEIAANRGSAAQIVGAGKGADVSLKLLIDLCVAYTGSSSVGPEISATHLPANSAAEAPQGHIAAPIIANTTIQCIRIVVALLVVFGIVLPVTTVSRQDTSAHFGPQPCLASKKSACAEI